jgi:DNA-binding SARP family transcriptional activator
MNPTLRARLGAAAALITILIGPPLLLATLAGWPLPSGDSLQQALDLRWISPTLALQLGATVAWLAWLHLTACIAAAALAQLRHQDLSLPLPHTMAAYVNATIALLLVSTSLGGGRHVTIPSPSIVATAAVQTTTAVSAVPAGAPSSYEVQPRDTLWDIAESHLGNPLRWREIWKLNAGHTMTDGATFDDPNLIRPGWVLQLPHQHAQQVAPRTPAPPQGPAAAPGLAPLSATPPEAPAVVAPPVAVAAPSTTDSRAEQGPAEHKSALPTGLGLGASAVGVLALLARRRRQAARKRPHGKRVPLPVGELVDAERALSNSANLDAAETLAGTLRLAAALTPADTTPTLDHVTQSDAGVTLHFRDPIALPEPFASSDGGWLLPREHYAATYGAADRADPAPVLVHLGSHAGDELYLNLETYGALAIEGDSDRVEELVDRVALSLNAAPWTSLVEVCTTSSDTAAADLTGKTKVIDLAVDLTRLQALARSSHDQVRADTASLAQARWLTAEPTDGASVVICPADNPSASALTDLAADPLTPIVALLLGAAPGVACLTVGDGTISLPEQPVPLAVATPEPALLDTARQLIDLTEQPAVEPDTEPYAAVHADAPAQDEPAEMVVLVLGPLDIAGPIPKLPPQLRDIVLYLALHRRGVSLGEMATALWPEALRSEKTLRNRMHELRRAIGGRVSLGPGWAFDDTVTTDWAQFQALARGSLEDQQHALDLVRGQPLHDVKGDWTSLEGFEAEMEAAIVDLAIDVSEKLLADGDPDAATRAAKAGLRACPWEERLYQSAMRAAADRGAIGEVKTLYNELRALLDIEDDDEPDPETQFLYEELLQTARRVSTSTE